MAKLRLKHVCASNVPSRVERVERHDWQHVILASLHNRAPYLQSQPFAQRTTSLSSWQERWDTYSDPCAKLWLQHALDTWNCHVVFWFVQVVHRKLSVDGLGRIMWVHFNLHPIFLLGLLGWLTHEALMSDPWTMWPHTFQTIILKFQLMFQVQLVSLICGLSPGSGEIPVVFWRLSTPVLRSM